jgi:FMN reductase [NAD(P)H]
MSDTTKSPNETIALMQAHCSVRSYTDQPVPDEVLRAVIEAAHRGPTSFNGQHVSLVVVRDPARRARIAEITGGQPWIAQAPVFITVLVDFHKTDRGAAVVGQTQVIQESVEGLMAGALDAGIALGNLMIAARSFGLGIVAIGAIRKDPQAMIDLLALPRLTFPIAGICLGHFVGGVPQKPRLDISSFRHDETYRADGLDAVIADYDHDIQAYWREIGRPDGKPWSANTASRYCRQYFDKVRPVAASQGFLADK